MQKKKEIYVYSEVNLIRFVNKDMQLILGNKNVSSHWFRVSFIDNSLKKVQWKKFKNSLTIHRKVLQIIPNHSTKITTEETIRRCFE